MESQLTKSRKDANDLKKQISDLEGTLAISQDTTTTLQSQLKKEKDLVSSLRRDMTGRDTPNPPTYRVFSNTPY